MRGSLALFQAGRRVARLPARLADGHLTARLAGTTLPVGTVTLRLRVRPKTKPVPLTTIEIR